MSMFDDVTVEVECPTCNKEISIYLDQVGKSTTCPHCKTTINLKDAGLTDELNKFDNAIDNLFKNF